MGRLSLFGRSRFFMLHELPELRSWVVCTLSTEGGGQVERLSTVAVVARGGTFVENQVVII